MAQGREKEVRRTRATSAQPTPSWRAYALQPGVPVEGEDGDDIVAVLAQALGATSLILGADQDMFRYDDTVLPDARSGAFAFSFAEVEQKQITRQPASRSGVSHEATQGGRLAARRAGLDSNRGGL